MASLITTGVRRKLYVDAQLNDEWATTRLWEYVMRHYFRDDEYVVSSQQPPYVGTPNSLRRVDLVVEHVSNTTGDASTILMFELKKHGATEDDIRRCETQAWEAAYSYSLRDVRTRPVWYMTAIGTAYRIWIMDPRDDHDHPVAVLPGVHAHAEINQYLDVEFYGKSLVQALRFIKKNHIPPQFYMMDTTPPPASSDQEMSSPSPLPEVAAAAAKAPIPLSEEFWIQVTILHNGEGIVTSRDNNNREFLSSSKDWTLRYKLDRSTCYTYIDPTTKNVYWSTTLKPDKLLPRQSVAEGEQHYRETSQMDALANQVPSVNRISSNFSQPQEDAGEGPSSKKVKRWKEVRVVVIPKPLVKDVWKFENARKSQQETKRTEWKRIRTSELGEVWAFEGSSHIYYTKQNLHNP